MEKIGNDFIEVLCIKDFIEVFAEIINEMDGVQNNQLIF